MGKIYCIIGMTCSGKTTLYTSLIKLKDLLNLTPALQYTTRDIREGEEDGVDYNFVSIEEFLDMLNADKMIEYRSYDSYLSKNTNQQVSKYLYYGTNKDTFDNIDNTNYLYGNCDIDTFVLLRKEFGEDTVIPLFLHSSYRDLLLRSLSRIDRDDVKGHKETCRRFIKDIDRYSVEEAKNVGIDENNMYNTSHNRDYLIDIISKIMNNNK